MNTWQPGENLVARRPAKVRARRVSQQPHPIPSTNAIGQSSRDTTMETAQTHFNDLKVLERYHGKFSRTQSRRRTWRCNNLHRVYLGDGCCVSPSFGNDGVAPSAQAVHGLAGDTWSLASPQRLSIGPLRDAGKIKRLAWACCERLRKPLLCDHLISTWLDLARRRANL